jgi:molybdopterin-guanine dinucleotide biosynthesis protein A
MTDQAKVVPGLGAIVLCGGSSSRMGRSKAELDFRGEALLQRVVRRIQGAVSPVVVVAAIGQSLPSLPRHVHVARDSATARGPLEGLLVGLSFLRPLVDAAYVSSTDAPFVSAAVIRRLAAQRAAADSIVVPTIGGHAQPLAAIYSTSLTDAIEQLHREGRAGPFAMLERVHTHFVEEETIYSDPEVMVADPRRWSFRNVNTPEAYELALRDAELIAEAEASSRE